VEGGGGGGGGRVGGTQLYKIFKEYTGMTPGDFHKKCKVEHIKEKLMDNSLTIKQAFSACGEDSQGRIARVFKTITGLSPAEFRRTQWKLQTSA